MEISPLRFASVEMTGTIKRHFDRPQGAETWAKQKLSLLVKKSPTISTNTISAVL